jgi:N6-adenosine-specific RNA methylase IME4
MTWPFAPLKMFGYGAILADPPWAYAMYSEKGYAKAPEAQYATLSDKEILALPVNDLAQRDCLLVLWATWPRLDFAHQVVKAWGFRHVTGGAWIKRTRHGCLRWGTGYSLRSVCEPFIVARMGQPQASGATVPNAVGWREPIDFREIGGITIEGLAREHSRKPPQMRDIVELLSPHAFRCELFGREAWPGNEVWGWEAGKFDAATAPRLAAARPSSPAEGRGKEEGEAGLG